MSALTPLEMLVKLCAPCPYYTESKLFDGKVKPECKIHLRWVCLQAADVFLTLQYFDAKGVKVLILTDEEVRFLRELLDSYFSSFNSGKGPPFQVMLNSFSGTKIISVPEGLLRRLERLGGS